MSVFSKGPKQSQPCDVILKCSKGHLKHIIFWFYNLRDLKRCVCACAYESRCPQRQEEGTRSPQVGVTCRYEPPSNGAGTQTWVLSQEQRLHLAPGTFFHSPTFLVVLLDFVFSFSWFSFLLPFIFLCSFLLAFKILSILLYLFLIYFRGQNDTLI